MTNWNMKLKRQTGHQLAAMDKIWIIEGRDGPT